MGHPSAAMGINLVIEVFRLLDLDRDFAKDRLLFQIPPPHLQWEFLSAFYMLRVPQAWAITLKVTSQGGSRA